MSPGINQITLVWSYPNGRPRTAHIQQSFHQSSPETVRSTLFTDGTEIAFALPGARQLSHQIEHANDTQRALAAALLQEKSDASTKYRQYYLILKVTFTAQQVIIILSTGRWTYYYCSIVEKVIRSVLSTKGEAVLFIPS